MFLKSIQIITMDNLDYVDCELAFKLIKLNVHFNLHYDFQVYNFESKCNYSVF